MHWPADIYVVRRDPLNALDDLVFTYGFTVLEAGQGDSSNIDPRERNNMGVLFHLSLPLTGGVKQSSMI